MKTTTISQLRNLIREMLSEAPLGDFPADPKTLGKNANETTHQVYRDYFKAAPDVWDVFAVELSSAQEEALLELIGEEDDSYPVSYVTTPSIVASIFPNLRFKNSNISVVITNKRIFSNHEDPAWLAHDVGHGFVEESVIGAGTEISSYISEYELKNIIAEYYKDDKDAEQKFKQEHPTQQQNPYWMGFFTSKILGKLLKRDVLDEGDLAPELWQKYFTQGVISLNDGVVPQDLKIQLEEKANQMLQAAAYNLTGKVVILYRVDA